MYDVIVIGAGPAGCTAAKVLAENGYQVLLAEKFKMPRYKSCSGQLIKKSIDLVRRYYGAEVPESVLCTPTKNRGMIFTDDKGKEYRFEQQGLNIWRSAFDCWLAERAAESGAEVWDGAAAVSCAQGDGDVTVTFRGGKVDVETARYVIDCEGVVGSIKRKLLPTAAVPRYITTFQTYNRGRIDLDYRYFHAYLQPELSGYDAWFNVKDEMLVLGVSVRDGKGIEDYYQRFIDYMKKHHHLKIDPHRQLRTDRWLMPRVLPGCPIDYGVGRVLFAGEIAGFLNPMGEGISAGLESGFCAAQAVMGNFGDEGTILSDYHERTEDLHNYMKRQWRFAGGLAETFGDMK